MRNHNVISKMNHTEHIKQLEDEGYSIIPPIYSESEILSIGKMISELEVECLAVIKSKDLFAIRQLFNEIPALKKLVFNKNLLALIQALPSENKFFISKAIYFDKPKDSNWFVAYHQDLVINVSERKEIVGFKNWTNKRDQIGVQPPLNYLKRTVTLRIHLDDTDKTNGALRIIPNSHKKGVIRSGNTPDISDEIRCDVKRGGVMLMKPLMLHASSRSKGNSKRRVIHLEFCDLDLPHPLIWKEKNSTK